MGSLGRTVFMGCDGLLQIKTGSAVSSGFRNEFSDEENLLDDQESASGSCDLHSEESNDEYVVTLVDILEQEYLENRDVVVDENLAFRTPLKVVKDMASEHDTEVKVKIFEIHVPSTYVGQERIIQRVRMDVRDFSGDGQAPRYRLAMQLAAADLLENMKKDKKGLQLVPYGMLPGCRINPWVYKDLQGYCRMNKYAMPKYKQIQSDKEHFFAYKCTVNQFQTIGKSDSIYLAKRISARLMFEQLLREPYPDDEIGVGSGCLGLEDLRFIGSNPMEWDPAAAAVGMEGNGFFSSGFQFDHADDEGCDDFYEPEDMIAVGGTVIH